jgi:hypothetical protein
MIELLLVDIADVEADVEYRSFLVSNSGSVSSVRRCSSIDLVYQRYSIDIITTSKYKENIYHWCNDTNLL